MVFQLKCTAVSFTSCVTKYLSDDQLTAVSFLQYAFSEFVTTSCKWGKLILESQILFSLEKNGAQYVWRFFATWNELFTRLSFCKRPEYNREKNWACCTSFCSFWNETSNNCFIRKEASNFAYILKVKDCDLECVGRYKDQKAYSYFDSGFVDTIFIYKPSSCRNKIFLYSKVQSSLTVSDKKML